ncbi:hypothetical protein H0E87_020617, partial [Populus deltoides]
ERLVWKGFNIEDEVGSAEKPLVKQVLNVNVTNNKMRLAVLKSLIGEFMVQSYQPSLYFLVSYLKVYSSGKKKGIVVVVGAVGASCLVAIILVILWWEGNLPGKLRRKRGSPKCFGTPVHLAHAPTLAFGLGSTGIAYAPPQCLSNPSTSSVLGQLAPTLSSDIFTWDVESCLRHTP